MNADNAIRLQKYLAECGLGSRRFCETLIQAGRVAVDGETVTRLGAKVDPTRQRVRCNGKPVVPEGKVVVLLNKPTHVICSSDDPQGRTCAIDLVDDLPERIYTVGRLDFMSEGLIVLTNDGELAHALMHPRHHVRKTYRVWIDAPLSSKEIERAKRGIADGGETLRMLEVEPGRPARQGTEYLVVLGEGRNRHIRRMMDRMEKKVLRLLRVAIGPLELGDLKSGEWRHAKPSELKRLRQTIAEARKPPPDRRVFAPANPGEECSCAKNEPDIRRRNK